MIGTPFYSEAAITTVTTEANKLAQTGLKIGQLTLVTFGGTGKALYRYNGGGESTATNWTLLGPASVWANNDQSFANTTFADVTGGAIDWLPVGKYRVELLFQAFDDLGGFKWQLTGTSTVGASARAQVVYSNLVSLTTDIMTGFTYGPTATTVQQSVTGYINVTAAGTLKLQAAQNTDDGTTFLTAFHMVVTPIA